MPFRKLLTELVESAPGASGAILSDWEGESVELVSAPGDDYGLKLLAAHLGIILARARAAAERHSGAGPLDIVVTTGAGRCIVGTVGPDYALAMTLHRDAPVGRPLKRFRDTREMLVKEIY